MAKRDRGPSPEDEELFEEAMEGVERLRDRRRVLRRRRLEARGRYAEPPRAVPFAVEETPDGPVGRAPGVSHEVVGRLRGGEPAVDLRLDLHGLSQEVAREEVRALLERARRAGVRCLLIVHGRGARSPAGPVLKEALPGWLTAAPYDRHILAFTPADPPRGGAGATLVLLRKPR